MLFIVIVDVKSINKKDNMYSMSITCTAIVSVYTLMIAMNVMNKCVMCSKHALHDKDSMTAGEHDMIDTTCVFDENDTLSVKQCEQPATYIELEYEYVTNYIIKNDIMSMIENTKDLRSLKDCSIAGRIPDKHHERIKKYSYDYSKLFNKELLDIILYKLERPISDSLLLAYIVDMRDEIKNMNCISNFVIGWYDFVGYRMCTDTDMYGCINRHSGSILHSLWTRTFAIYCRTLSDSIRTLCKHSTFRDRIADVIGEEDMNQDQ